MPYNTQPSNTPPPKEFVSDGTCARFVKVRGRWHISLAPQMAEIVDIGTAVTCDVETKAGKRYTRSGTVIRVQRMPDGTPRALCRIEEFRAGRASDERNTFAMLPSGDWGVRLHVSTSRRARVGDTLEVAVTAKSGRIAHVTARVTDIVENEHGDRQAIGEIVERDNGRSQEPQFEAAHGVTEPCPICGTTACDSGITGRCAISPEQHPRRFGDIPLADTPREDLDTHIEPIALAQDWDHWSQTSCRQGSDLTTLFRFCRVPLRVSLLVEWRRPRASRGGYAGWGTGVGPRPLLTFYLADLAGASFEDATCRNADFRNPENLDKCRFAGSTELEDCVFDSEEERSASSRWRAWVRDGLAAWPVPECSRRAWLD